MGRIMNGLVGIVVAGLLVAILREFNWDPFAAAEWALSRVWEVISHVADLWSSNDTFKDATKKPD